MILREPLIIHFLLIPRLDRGIHVFDFMDSRFRGNDRKRLYGEFLEVPLIFSSVLGRLILRLPFATMLHADNGNPIRTLHSMVYHC